MWGGKRVSEFQSWLTLNKALTVVEHTHTTALKDCRWSYRAVVSTVNYHFMCSLSALTHTLCPHFIYTSWTVEVCHQGKGKCWMRAVFVCVFVCVCVCSPMGALMELHTIPLLLSKSKGDQVWISLLHLSSHSLSSRPYTLSWNNVILIIYLISYSSLFSVLTFHPLFITFHDLSSPFLVLC